MPKQPFSKRNRYSGGPKEITIREDAPENLRYFILETAHDLGWTPSPMREVLCRVLHTPPDPSNWSEYPNIEGEEQTLIYGAAWYKVYDLIEHLHARMLKADERKGTDNAEKFTEELNEFFIEEGIGWQLVDGPYFSNYERFAIPWKLAMGEVDGEPVVIILQRGADTWTPHSVVRLTVVGQHIGRIVELRALPVGNLDGRLRSRRSSPVAVSWKCNARPGNSRERP